MKVWRLSRRVAKILNSAAQRSDSCRSYLFGKSKLLLQRHYGDYCLALSAHKAASHGRPDGGGCDLCSSGISIQLYRSSSFFPNPFLSLNILFSIKPVTAKFSFVGIHVTAIHPSSVTEWLCPCTLGQDLSGDRAVRLIVGWVRTLADAFPRPSQSLVNFQNGGQKFDVYKREEYGYPWRDLHDARRFSITTER